MDQVNPGDPATSYLVAKLTGVGMCGGRQMPIGTAWSDDRIAIVSAWIEAGAVR